MLERFGSKSLRLIRLLLTKEHLEQKQVTVFSEQVSKYFEGIVSLLFRMRQLLLELSILLINYCPSILIILACND